MSNIKSIEVLDEEVETCDLEVEHPDHQFYLANGVLTSNSHAIAYSIDSYYCAWLLTHYEPFWLCAYLEASSGNPKEKPRAISTVKSMGYDIVPLDINLAESSWRILPNKKFMPSFLSCKDVGAAAVEEILRARPYKTFEDVLWNEDGSWKHSKFNKKALGALISIGAFGSLDCVGEDKMFASYKQMFHVCIEKSQEIKRTTKKEPHEGRKRFFELLKETRDIGEWTAKERVELMVEFLGSVDGAMLVPGAVLKVLDDKGIVPIDSFFSSTSDDDDEENTNDELENKSDLCWFITMSGVAKKTKNKRDYVLAEVIGAGDKKHKMFIWGAPDTTSIGIMQPSVAAVKKSEFGFSVNYKQMRKLNV